MFPLTRPQRQALATAALVALTVLPTAYVAWTAWRINRAGHLREVEAEIGRALALRVSLEGVVYPRPGEVVYRGMVLREEEPRGRGLTEVGRLRELRLRRGPRELTVAADGLDVRGESPRLLMARVGAWLQRSGSSPFERVSVSAPALELDLGGGALRYSLRDVAGVLQADRKAPAVTASYRLASKGATSRCELSLVRDRGAEPVRTTLTLKTMEGPPLPAHVLEPFFDTAGWLGADAKVDGALTLRQDGARDWEADFRGDLVDVDLATLVGRQFPGHHLSGLARMSLESARWAVRPGQGPGWVEARGALTTGHGSIGVGLVRALGAEMKFRLAPRLATLDDRRPVVDFRALGLAFAMTSDGEIKISGALGNEYAPDVVLAGTAGALAYAPAGASNVRGLIKTLFPVGVAGGAADPGVLVPLTAGSRVLLCLPVPPDLDAKAATRIGGN
jgi:hypothetical protein